MDEKEGQYPIRTSYSRIFDGVDVHFNGEGFFMDSSQWTEKIFEELAHEAGITEITDKHRKVVDFIRKFYAEQGRQPLNQHLKIGTQMSLMELEALFPGGISHGARRLAGMRGSRGCRG